MPLLLIDLDNTLLDREASFTRWACGFVARHGLPEDAVDFLREADEDGYAPRDAVLGAVRTRYAVTAPLEELLAAYAAEYPELAVPPAASTLELLAELRRRGWRIGIVTNGSPRQARKVAAARIEHLFDALCISDVEGSTKPEPDIFRLAAERCGLPLEGAWMVGDHAEYDVAGGAAVGLHTIWLRRGRTWPLVDVRPTHEADSLDEALGLLLALDN